MKKALSLLIAICMLLSVTQTAVYASETENGAAGDPSSSGVTGDCAWSFDDSTGTLKISGNGAMADYYDSTMVPWFSYQGRIKAIEISDGVTGVGDSAFAYIGGVKGIWIPDSVEKIGAGAFSNTGLTSVSIPYGVTLIGARAFENCKSLSFAKLPESLESIGVLAFGNTMLSGVVLPGKNTQISYYAFGFDSSGNKTEGFTVSGYSKSTAQNYAVSNGFGFIDLDGKMYALRVPYARALNTATGEYVEKARAGERIKIVPTGNSAFNVNKYHSNDCEVELIGGEYYFTMPAKTVEFFIEYEDKKAIKIDLTGGGKASIEVDKYTFLTVTGNLDDFLTSRDTDNGIYYYDLDKNGSNDICIERYTVSALPTSSIQASFTYSFNGSKYSFVTFLFSGEAIQSAKLFIELPKAGDTYDYETNQAEVYPVWESGYTVAEAHWFNEWGIAPNVFEAGEKYFAEIKLRPNEGYSFYPDCSCVIDGAEAIEGTSAENLGLDAEGNLITATANIYIPGDAHPIYITGGIAVKNEAEYNSVCKISEARAGEKVWVNVGTDDIADNEYVVQGSIKYESDDVIFSGESGQYFIMPDEDVSINLTYKTLTQMDGVMDLRNSTVYRALYGENTFEEQVTCQNYGIYLLLMEHSANSDLSWSDKYNEVFERFDVDGDSSYDIGKVKNEYFLLDTSSLDDPTGSITLTFNREESMTAPMRSLRIIFDDPTVEKHKITVKGGMAVLKANDWAGEYRVTEAYPGEVIYLLPDCDDIKNGEYLVQRTLEATSKDVNITGEGDTLFTMPDKDVTIDVAYEKDKQFDGVMDLRDGSYTASVGELYSKSEAYGMYFVMLTTSKRVYDWYDEQTGCFMFRFDIDGSGDYDVEYNDKTKTFTLLENNSLRPASGRITLSLPQSEYRTIPMTRLTVLLAGADSEQTPHKITVKNGLATSVENSVDYIITQEYQGQVVYVISDPSAVPNGKYCISATVTSKDTQLIWESNYSFVMPDRDVTIEVNMKFAGQKPYVLDLTSGKAVVEDESVFKSIDSCLKEASKITLEFYDEEVYSDVCFYDLDGDGKNDICREDKTKTFELFNKELNASESIVLSKDKSYLLPYYPLTVIFSKPRTGDVNADGVVNINDVTTLQKYLVQQIALSGAQLGAADANGDESVNINDATTIQKHIAGLINYLG